MERNESVVLTQKQKQIVERLKEHLKKTKSRTEPFICDHFIFRFLVARKWNENATQTMLDNYFIFRDRMIARLGELDHRKRKSKQSSFKTR